MALAAALRCQAALTDGGMRGTVMLTGVASEALRVGLGGTIVRPFFGDAACAEAWRALERPLMDAATEADATPLLWTAAASMRLRLLQSDDPFWQTLTVQRIDVRCSYLKGTH
jgi:hypothetical protein